VRGWEAAALARHPERPTSASYLRLLLPDFIELHGDRMTGDDPAVVAGIGRIEGLSVAVIAQERGHGAEAEHRRGGRMTAAGYRKAARLMRLAGHLELPLITLIDTPGAVTGVEAEAGGIGVAISQALGLMAMLPVPIVSVVIGEGGGASALALATGDRILMQEHAVFAAVGSESAGSHRYRAGDRAAEPSSSLTMTARECQRLGFADTIIPEPTPAAHADPDFAAVQLRLAIVQALAELVSAGPRRLLDDRVRKMRTLGQTTPEGREAARLELRELQELQRSLGRSLDDLRHDLRDRWDNRNITLNLPNLPALPNLPPRWHLHRPDLGDLAGRLSAIRSSITPPNTVIVQPSRDTREDPGAAPAEKPQPDE
jgi:acetyl-CoA carboxylase carboxyl transferase subunit beta